MIVILVFLLGVDLRYLDKMEEKTTKFPFCPENKVIPKDEYNEYLKKTNSMNYTRVKKLLCDWTDKKNIQFSLEC